jgi:exopolysaccharide biosynthesis predicted pyruvyltransferase EpsI
MNQEHHPSARPSASNHDCNLIARLAGEIEQVMRACIPPGARCALLDYPNHANVGDSAIWLGEINMLSNRVSLVYFCDKDTYRREQLAETLGPDDIILLHGGGNLGDLWVDHQELRERVIHDFPRHRIIQLPQTIYFREASNLNRARDIFNAHAGFLLLCRDRASLQFARREFTGLAMLCPDMALGLGPLPRETSPCLDALWLSRTDEESAQCAHPEIPTGVEMTDWLDEQTTPTCQRNWSLSERLAKDGSQWKVLLPPLMENFNELARERLRRGCEILGRGRSVITDRLHGHILCMLLGIPHVLIDNSYGKVSGFYETWTSDSRLARWAPTPAHALNLALMGSDAA